MHHNIVNKKKRKIIFCHHAYRDMIVQNVRQRVSTFAVNKSKEIKK